MKKFITYLVVVSMLCLTMACGDTKVINGVEYDTVGLMSEKNPDIEYRVIFGNIVWSVLLVETIFAPIYFLGWSIQEPVGVKNSDPKMIGAVK